MSTSYQNMDGNQGQYSASVNSHNTKDTNCSSVSSSLDLPPVTDFKQFQQNITQSFSPAGLSKILKNYHIPLSLLGNFETELLRTHMVVKFYSSHVVRPLCQVSILPISTIGEIMESKESDIASSDSDISDEESSNITSSEEDVENDSDLEYW